MITGSSILFFPVNGSGMGHLTRCLAYARRLRHKAECIFFSLSSAMDYVEEMSFSGDYFVSPFWSVNSTYIWNCELAVRFGMILEQMQPNVVVFDGTWPFQGFLNACAAYDKPLKLVWSHRGGLKKDTKTVPVNETLFDLILEPGELGAAYKKTTLPHGGTKLIVPPVLLLDDAECLCQKEARNTLHLTSQGRYALLSLGPGNLKDISSIGHGLIQRLQAAGYTVVWACPPISVRDVELPPKVIPLAVYPLTRYLQAFDCMVSAAGYNTCCEVVQAQIPCLLVPNELLADDQARRAHLVAQYAPAVVHSCETPDDMDAAVRNLLHRVEHPAASPSGLNMNGAALAADALLHLANAESHS